MAKGDGDKETGSSRETSAEVKDKQKKVPPVDKNGIPIKTYDVPGLSRKPGTPGWASGPAKAAARKAK
jgi:hypothetical protein